MFLAHGILHTITPDFKTCNVYKDRFHPFITVDCSFRLASLYRRNCILTFSHFTHFRADALVNVMPVNFVQVVIMHMHSNARSGVCTGIVTKLGTSTICI